MKVSTFQLLIISNILNYKDAINVWGPNLMKRTLYLSRSKSDKTSAE